MYLSVGRINCYYERVKGNSLDENEEKNGKRTRNSIFSDESVMLEVPISPDKDTVWITQEQMSKLFDTARSSIAYHITNIFKEEELLRILLSKFSTEVKGRLQDHLYTII